MKKLFLFFAAVVLLTIIVGAIYFRQNNLSQTPLNSYQGIMPESTGKLQDTPMVTTGDIEVDTEIQGMEKEMDILDSQIEDLDRDL